MKTLYLTFFLLLYVSVIHSQVVWQKHGSPVLDLGTSPSWDDTYVGFGSVIYDGTIYKMWYSGGRSGFTFQIGYAESTDGINWVKHSSNPVLTFGSPGSFDEGALWGSSVIYDEGIYKMWYSGSSPTTLDYWRIGYATSPDGINWTKHPSYILDIGSPGEWDDFHIAMPSVLKENNTYKMWYHGGRAYVSGHIGYAESPDGINWIKYDDPQTTSHPYAESDPILTTGVSGTWNSIVVWQPNVIYNNVLQSYEMWYVTQGNDPVFPRQNMGYASSFDGMVWTKYGTTPVMTGTPGAFDHSLVAPRVIFEGTSYKLWYTGTYLDINWRIGYATAEITVPVELENFSSITFSLEQNYPNPFNPSTTISWQSPVAGHHVLKVFDVLGSEVATLVNEYKPAGSYEVEFDGSNLTSGIYLYKLTAGEYNAARKLVLLK